MKNKREQVEKGILLVKGGVWPWQGESRELLLYYIAHQWPRRGGRRPQVDKETTVGSKSRVGANPALWPAAPL